MTNNYCGIFDNRFDDDGPHWLAYERASLDNPDKDTMGYNWYPVTDDVRRGLAIIAQIVHDEYTVSELPLSNTLWEPGTLLMTGGILYEWRKD